MEHDRLPKLVRRERIAGTIALACVFAAAPPLFMLSYFASQFHGLSEPVALEQAQLARNIALGRGYTTNVITPLSILRNPDLLHHPEATNAPLGPLLIATAYRIASPSDTAAAMVTVILWLLVLGVTWLFAWRAFGPGASALATIAVGLNTSMLSSAISAAPRMLLTLLCTLLLYAMYELGAVAAQPESSPRRLLMPVSAAVWGLIFGLACLASPAAVFLVPGVLAYLWIWPEGRKARSVAFLVATAIVVSPWLVRNTIVFGNPLFSLRWYDLAMYTQSYPADSLLHEYAPPPSPIIFCFTHPGQVLMKMVTALGGLRDSLFETSDFYVAAVFVVSVLLRLEDERLQKIRLAVCAMIVATALGTAATRPEAQSLVPFVPFVTIVAAGVFLGQLWRMELSFQTTQWRRARIDIMRWIIILLVIALLVYPVGMLFQRTGWSRPPPRKPLEAGEGLIPEGQPVATNMPWDVAWHLDRYFLLGSPLRPSPRGEPDLFWHALADPAPVTANGYQLIDTFEVRMGLRAVVRRSPARPPDATD